MGVKFYNHYFTNNESYGGGNFPNLDSLAYVVQEFLYTTGWAVQTINYGDTGGGYPHFLEFDCQMDMCIKLYDFMSIVHDFIEAAYSDFAKATIKEYISDLQQHEPEEHAFNTFVSDYGCFCITHASNELIVSLLWATWIYIRARNDPYRNADLLYDLMNENYPYGIKDFAKHPLIAKADDAVRLMIQHKKDKEEEIRLFVEEMGIPKENTVPDARGSVGFSLCVGTIPRGCRTGRLPGARRWGRAWTGGVPGRRAPLRRGSGTSLPACRC